MYIQAQAKYIKRRLIYLKKKSFVIGLCLIASFVVWTAAICFIDVGSIGPKDSEVGFSTVNGLFHSLTGVNMFLYTVTDWLGLIPIGFAGGFAMFGLAQLIKRKQLGQVDRSIIVLGIFYIVVLAFYIFFEKVVINCRPVLIDGILEASYPSSTTMLVLCVMPTAIMQFNARIKNKMFRICISSAITAFIAFMVVSRLLSGVHWLTDIIGGALLSAGLVTVYYSFISGHRE